MSILFISVDFKSLIKFIFDIYDFNNKGYLLKSDVKIVFSYLPLNIKEISESFKMEKEKFSNRLNSQKEISEYIEILFSKEDIIDLEKFDDRVTHNCSEIFIYVLLFILENKPFNDDSVNNYKGKTLEISDYLKFINSNNKSKIYYIKTPKSETEFKFSPEFKTKEVQFGLKKTFYSETTTTIDKNIISKDSHGKKNFRKIKEIQCIKENEYNSNSNSDNNDNEENNPELFCVINNCEIDKFPSFIQGNEFNSERNISSSIILDDIPVKCNSIEIANELLKKNESVRSSNTLHKLSNKIEKLELDSTVSTEGELYKISKLGILKKRFYKLFGKDLFCMNNK
jgi:hypothetical protein